MPVRTDRSDKKVTEIDLPSGRVMLTYPKGGSSGTPAVRTRTWEPAGGSNET